MRLAKGEAGIGLVLTAARARKPPVRPLRTASPLEITSGDAIGDVEEDVGERLRPNSR